MTHEELALQVQWLTERVLWLEAELQRQQSSKLPKLRALHYHIDKLYVRELSGTLNIGITSIGGLTEVSELTDLPGGTMEEEWEPLDDDITWFNPPDPHI